MVEVSFEGSETKEASFKDEDKLVGDDMTQQSGGSSTIHEIPPFAVEDMLRQATSLLRQYNN